MTLTREQRLERKLRKARRDRDRWQARYRHVAGICKGLQRRRSWVESYVGFRIEYRLRGGLRRLRRYRRWAWSALAR